LKITELRLSQSNLVAINLNLDVRGESSAIQGGNLSLIRVSKLLFLVRG